VLKRRSYYAMRIGDSRLQERTAREAMALGRAQPARSRSGCAR
jgi:hypothetical protein